MSPEQIFTRPGSDFLGQLAGLPRHLDAVMPMRRQHRHELAGQIRQLSHLLTDERDDLKRDYLSDPAALSAYLRYFLPWNIYRLGVLFAGLALDPGGDNPEAEATIIDLGAGPLTTALALWMARPHLRRRKLHFICVDRAQRPMRAGLDTLKSLAAKNGLEPWRFTLVKGSLDERLREKADLVVMGNVLNEVLHRGEGALLEDAEVLAAHLCSMLTPAGQLMVVEPGIRPSAHLLSALRRGLLHRGLKPLSPCPHTGPCPMSGRGYTAWCHFNFDAEAAPAWLKRQSEDARLTKDNVSLSFLFFSARGRKLEAEPGKSLVRAVSGPFELPAAGKDSEGQQRRFGQYCCSERGLTLLSLPQKHLVPLPGTLLEAAWPADPTKDAKSGALVLPLCQVPGADQPAPAPVPASARSARPKPARKPPRLPSERPMERGPKPKAKAKPATETAPRSESGSASASGAAPKASDKTTAKPTRLPSERPLKRGPKPEHKASGNHPDSAAGKTSDRTATPSGQARAAHADMRAGKAADASISTSTGASHNKSPGKPADKTAGKHNVPSGYADDPFADAQVQEAARKADHRPAKKKPGRPAVKVVSKPESKKGGKSAPKADSRASRKAQKAQKSQKK